jgi:hypothetical protein
MNVVDVTKSPYNVVAGDFSAATRTANRIGLQRAIDDTGEPTTSWGRRVWIPKGEYYFDGEIHIRRRIILSGDGGWGESGGTTLYFPAGANGLIVYRNDIFPDAGFGDWSTIEHLSVQGEGKTTVAHGVLLRARARCIAVGVALFKGDGFHVSAGKDVPNPGDHCNANNSHFESCRASLCDGWGLNFDTGGDINACTVVQFDASACLAGGIRLDDFLGNTLVGCHVDTEAPGPGYKAGGGPSYSTLIGCYIEGDHTGEINYPGIVVGGNLAKMCSAESTGMIIGGSGCRNVFSRDEKFPGGIQFYMGRDDGAHAWAWRFGQDQAPSGFVVSDMVPHYQTAAPGWLMSFWNRNFQTGGIGLAGEHAQLRGQPVPRGIPWFPQAFFLGDPVQGTVCRWMQGSAPPTTEAFEQGDIVWNTSPSPGEPIGWACVTSGTPGVWKGFGRLDP